MEPTQKKNGGRRCVGPRLHDVRGMGQGPELGTDNVREREGKTKSKEGRISKNQNIQKG